LQRGQDQLLRFLEITRLEMRHHFSHDIEIDALGVLSDLSGLFHSHARLPRLWRHARELLGPFATSLTLAVSIGSAGNTVNEWSGFPSIHAGFPGPGHGARPVMPGTAVRESWGTAGG